MRHLLLVLTLYFIAAPPVAAEDKHVPDKDQRLDFRKLVEGLASPNKAIECNNKGSTYSIPPKYDWKAQEQVEENQKVLFEHCEEALPQLIEGCADLRYSMTARGLEEYTDTWTVGDVCSDIIADRVEVFRDHIRFEDASHWNKYRFVPFAMYEDATDDEKKQLRDWWQRHKGTSIRDLQIEAFDWAIEKRRKELKEVLNDADPDNADNRKAANDELADLAAARDELNKSKTSFPPREMRSGIVSPEGLDHNYKVVPWTDKHK
jgi:hypothetical protein